MFYSFMGSRKVKGAGGWNRTNRNGAYSSVTRLSMRSVRTQSARKGRPSLRSNSPFFSWARGEWLPFKVAYFMPVCKRARVGLLLSCLKRQVPSRSGQVRLWCILLSVLANRFASYLRTGAVVIAFHIVDLFSFVGFSEGGSIRPGTSLPRSIVTGKPICEH